MATVTAAAEHDALAGCVEVGEQRFLVIGDNLRANRHCDHDVVCARACSVAAGTVAALWCPEMLGIAEVDQRVQVLSRDEDDVAAATAIAAIGTAELHKFLTPERDHAVAAVAGT